MKRLGAEAMGHEVGRRNWESISFGEQRIKCPRWDRDQRQVLCLKQRAGLEIVT